MSKPTVVPGARATLLLSLAMSIIGITGVFNAYAFLTVTPEATGLNLGDPEATLALFTAMSRSPLIRGLEVGNLLASALLVIGSFLLTARRPSSLWWVKQAVIANMLYTLARIGGNFWFAYGHPDLIEALFVPFQSEPAAPASVQMMTFAISQSCAALIMLGVYPVMAKVSRREDVRSFVSRESPG